MCLPVCRDPFAGVLAEGSFFISGMFVHLFIMRKLFPFIFLFLCLQAFCAEPAKEQLLKDLRNATSDTARIQSLNALGRSYIISNEYILADSILELAFREADEKQLPNEKMSILVNLGVLYWYQDNYPKALDYYFQSLHLAEESGNKNSIGRALANIGLVYFNQGSRDKALEYYQKALKLKLEINDKKASTIILGNIGDIYKAGGEYIKALEYFHEAVQLSAELKEEGLVGYFMACSGSAYELKGDYSNAYRSFSDALEIAEKQKDKVMIAANNISLGGLLLHDHKNDEAEEHLQKGLETATAIHDLNNQRDAHNKLSGLYRAENKWRQALDHYMSYIALQDSIFNTENTRKSVQSEMNFEFDKKQAEAKAVQAEKDAITAEDLRQQKLQRNFFIAGFLLVLLIAVFIFRGYRQKQRSNKIIEAQTNEAEHQKELIEEKNKEITDSINYAKRLQEAILPPQKLFDQHLPENFILYKPKDIVAGDFYWLEHRNGITYVAAADCTGHGVPGAMVSVVCSNALNRAVKEFGITEPAKILDKTRELVLATFSKSDKDVKDGMDISLCAIHPDGKVEWAGAYNPLWYISEGEMKELTADKQPIGKTDDPKPFSNRNIQLKKGDLLYLFSDGYPDQFGGEKGKKFKYKPMKELLLKNSSLSPAEQKEQLEAAFNSWKGNLEQVDDVCIIGVRL
jgi:serine phosphatase RsbU (regulator of sigma subunit)